MGQPRPEGGESQGSPIVRVLMYLRPQGPHHLTQNDQIRQIRAVCLRVSACMISPFARNVFNCCSYFNTSACNLWHLTPAYILKLYNGNVDVHTLCKARMLLELLSVRSGASGLDRKSVV